MDKTQLLESLTGDWLVMRKDPERDSSRLLALGQRISDLLLDRSIPVCPKLHGDLWFTEGDAYPLPIAPNLINRPGYTLLATNYARTMGRLRATA